MKLLLPLLLLSVGLSMRAATSLPEAERLAVVATRVEAGCCSVEEGAAQPNPPPPVQLKAKSGTVGLEAGLDLDQKQIALRRCNGNDWPANVLA